MPSTADLPLHTGHVPQWMLRIMEKLAGAIVEYMVEVRGPSSVIAMLSDPLWFQAFNNVIGMDWDSSGSTTVVGGVLKTITWRNPHLGLLVLGGKGARMREVPREAERAADLLGLDPERLKAASKLAARVDSSLLQDGYDLYIHLMAVSEDGEYVVVQQGMNTSIGMARRYHVARYEVEEPHSGVAGTPSGAILNVTDRDSREARKLFLDIVGEGPRRVLRLLEEANRVARGSPTILDYIEAGSPMVKRPARPYYKPVIPSRNLIRSIERLASSQPSSEVELALAPGLGPKVVRALALIADIIYGVPTSTRDPTTHPLDPFLYAYAIGGKDGIPYKFDAKTAMEAYRFLEEALEQARIGEKAKARALERLRMLARRTLDI